jgi:ankyrin repeat protein
MLGGIMRKFQSRVFFLAFSIFFCSNAVLADYFPGDQYFSDFAYSGSMFGRWGSSSASHGPTVTLDLDPQSSSNNALRVAAREGRLDDLANLLQKPGVDINSKSKQGFTALMYASKNCSAKTVKFLIEHKADVNSKDLEGRTALIFAARESCWQVVQELTKVAGIDAGARDRNQKTAIDYANENAVTEVDGASEKVLAYILFSRHR